MSQNLDDLKEYLKIKYCSENPADIEKKLKALIWEEDDDLSLMDGSQLCIRLLKKYKNEKSVE